MAEDIRNKTEMAKEMETKQRSNEKAVFCVKQTAFSSLFPLNFHSYNQD
jgi:hypothetical protein